VWPEKCQGLGSEARENIRPEAPRGTHVPEKIRKGGGLNSLARKTKEEYVVSALTVLEPKRLQPTRARIRRVLECYPIKKFRRINNLVKMKHKKQYMFIEEPMRIDADKKDDQAMEKPTKLKSVTWVLRGTAKAMSTRKTKTAKAVPRVTPTRSKWRIWDPGRSEVIVFRGVIVCIKHDPTLIR
jgi:hypothetical protein